MPQANIWIRKDDWDKWKSIGNKPDFIHDALEVQDSTLHGTMYPKGETKIPGGKVIVSNTNIRVNKDGTMSPQDPKKPSKVTTKPWPKVEKELKDKFRGAEQAIADQIIGENTDPFTINAPEEVVKIAKSLNLSPHRDSNGLCKVHGIPLDSRGKCLQKGCKYA